MSEPVFLLALAIAGATIVMVARTIAAALTGRGASRSDVAQIRQQLEDTQAALANQSAQLGELQERLDFAERLLTQARDRSVLDPGEKRGGEL
jgi:hypothetical protein